jgi:hypothetical protein
VGLLFPWQQIWQIPESHQAAKRGARRGVSGVAIFDCRSNKFLALRSKPSVKIAHFLFVFDATIYDVDLAAPSIKEEDLRRTLRWNAENKKGG